VTEDFQSWFAFAEIGRTGKLDQGSFVKRDVADDFDKPDTFEEGFQLDVATRLKFRSAGLPAPTGVTRETPHAVLPIKLCDVQLLIAPFESSEQVAHFILPPAKQLPAQGRFDSRVFELGDIAGKFDLQRWATTWKGKLLQFGDDSLQDRQSLLPFLFRERRRRLIVLSLDQLAGHRNAHAAKNSFGLTDINLFGRKINMGPEVFELRLVDLSFAPLERQTHLRVADVDRVQERLVMEQGRVIDVERDLTDDSERVLSLFVIINPDVARDQTAKGIEREATNLRFDAVLAQFLRDLITPMPAEAFFRQVPAATEHGGEGHHDNETEHTHAEPARESRLSILRRLRSLRFENGRHEFNLKEPQMNTDLHRFLRVKAFLFLSSV
jgi:hypothetical protein